MEEVYRIGQDRLGILAGNVCSLSAKIATLANRHRCNKIETNGNIGFTLSCDERFIYAGFWGRNRYNDTKGQVFSDTDPYGEENWIDEESSEKIDLTKKYTYGHIMGKDVIIDPYMRWDNNRVFFKNEDDETVYALLIEDPENILL
jgi:hypothetical protein